MPRCRSIQATTLRYGALPLMLAVVILGFGRLLVSARESDKEPTVEVSYPGFTYATEPCTFTLQHFNNMHAYVFNGRKVSDSGALRHGKYERQWTPRDGSSSVELDWLRIPKQIGPDTGLAVALYSWEWVGGSSSQSNVIQVFGCNDGHPVVLQQISNDAHGLLAGVDYNVRAGVLTVKSVRYGSGAHCCPEKLDIVTFKWNGPRYFQRVRWKTVLMPK